MTPVTGRSPTGLMLLWLFGTVPGTALGGAGAVALHDSIVPSGGFLSLPLIEDAIFGGVYGAIWAVCLVLPHLGLVWAWTRLAGGSERTRAGLLLGMLACALPQAVALAMAMEPGVFLPAWGAVAFGLWLPRAVVPGLGPGAFARNA